MSSDISLSEVLNELMAREFAFHSRDGEKTRCDFEHMIATDFSEVGASGRRYSREDVLDVLERRQSTAADSVCEASDAQVRELAPDMYLITYSLIQCQKRRTRRASIWRRTPDGWKIVYHQGTVVTEPDAH